MPLTPEYKAMIIREVAAWQSPAEQRRLIQHQQDSLSLIKSPFQPVNVRLHHISQALLKPTE